jgi:hypothetical protein
MKKIYHISLSSHEEVLFRNDRDFAIGFNCLAEAAFVTDSKLLADGLMSTHWHSIVLTDDPQGFVHRKNTHMHFFSMLCMPGRRTGAPCWDRQHFVERRLLRRNCGAALFCRDDTLSRLTVSSRQRKGPFGKKTCRESMLG